MDAGWTVIPSVIIERQQVLGLDALDVNILLHLATYWWTPDNKPHPAKKTIADAIGVEPRTVQRRIAALEKGRPDPAGGAAHPRPGQQAEPLSLRRADQGRSALCRGEAARDCPARGREQGPRAAEGPAEASRGEERRRRGVAQLDRAPCFLHTEEPAIPMYGQGGHRFKSCRRAHLPFAARPSEPSRRDSGSATVR